MITHLLDTDIASFLMKGKFPSLQEQFLKQSRASWALSAVTLGELYFGLEPFPLSHPIRGRAHRFIRAAQILPWPVEAAAPYARLRQLSRSQPIGDRDLMIAAHAVALKATLVTNNVKHFSRLGDELRFENWIS